MFVAFILLLAVSVAVAVLSGGPASLRCAGVIYLNWSGLTIYVLISGDQTPEGAFLIADIISLVAVIYKSEEAWQNMLGAAYLGQIIMHLLKLGGGEDYYYWQILTALGYAQLLLLLLGALPFHERARNAGPC